MFALYVFVFVHPCPSSNSNVNLMLNKSMNIDIIEMRPSSEIQSGDGSDSVYEEYGNVYDEYGAVGIDELNVDVREVSDENETERNDDEYEEYDGEYEQYRTSESESAAPRITKKKMWVIFSVIFIAGLVVGLPVYFTRPPDNLQLPIISSTISNITTPTTISTLAIETVFDTSGKQLSMFT